MAKEMILKWGLLYLKAGWSIIPVEPRGKKPLIEWKEFQTRRATEQELKQWLETCPSMNLGIVTGPISLLAVVDLDGPLGVSFGIEKKLVSTIVQKTGNGRQVFYKWKSGIKNSVKQIAPGVDVRGEGGYVVVPPSIHPFGRMYHWERFVPDHIPTFPQEKLFAIFTGANLDNKIQNLAKTEFTSPNSKSEDWLSEALEEMKNGHVHNTLVSVLGKFRAHDFSIADTTRLLQPHCLVDGKPYEALEDKIKEIWGRYPSNARYEPSSRSQSFTQSNYGQQSTLSIKSPTNDNDFEQFNATLQRQSDMDNGRKLSSGFPTLDRYLEGGLKSERLFTVAARTGTGKTNFAIALARNLCEQSKKVLFFSTEFQYSKIWSRYMATLGAIGKFRNHAFYVCDSFSPNISQVEEAIKEVMPDVFIFDHINHIGEERESLGAFMQGANFLQRKYNCQGIMVAQLNRQADWVENGKRVEPRMSMLKGSGTIEQASSRVLLLSETRVTPEMCEIIGVLDKNDSGDRGQINFALYKSPYVFKELV